MDKAQRDRKYYLRIQDCVANEINESLYNNLTKYLFRNNCCYKVNYDYESETIRILLIVPSFALNEYLNNLDFLTI